MSRKLLITIFLMVISVAEAKFKFDLSTTYNGKSSLGSLGDRGYFVDIIKSDISVCNRYLYLDYRVSLKHYEAFYKNNIKYGVELNASTEFQYEFIKLGISQYYEEGDFIFQQNPILFKYYHKGDFDLNLFLYVKPHLQFNLQNHKCNLSLLTGFHPIPSSNILKVVVYSINFKTKVKIGTTDSYLALSCGRVENIESIQPINFNSALDFLDAFRINSFISTEDFFTIKLKQTIKILSRRTVFNLSAIEEMYYKRVMDSDSNSMKMTFIVGGEIESINEVIDDVYLNMKLRVLSAHKMHNQENNVWHDMSIELKKVFY